MAPREPLLVSPIFIDGYYISSRSSKRTGTISEPVSRLCSNSDPLTRVYREGPLGDGSRELSRSECGRSDCRYVRRGETDLGLNAAYSLQFSLPVGFQFSFPNRLAKDG